MKQKKYAWVSIVLTVLLVGLLLSLYGIGALSKNDAKQANSTEYSLSIAFLAVLALWVLCGFAGWIMLSRRGYFADQMEFLAAGNAWLGCIIGILLLAGLWMVAALPGPYIMWFASTRVPRPQCPKCKNWLPHGATKCVNCDIPLPGAILEGEERIPSAGSLEADQLVTGCENCHEVDVTGDKYFFFYGSFISSEYLGGNRTRYDFKIAGSQDVFLCERCVLEFGKKRIRPLSVGIPLGMVLLSVGFTIGQYINGMQTGVGSETNVPIFTSVFIIFTAIMLHFGVKRQSLKQKPINGDLLAIKLRKPHLKSQGYTRFYTREQMRQNQLL